VIGETTGTTARTFLPRQVQQPALERWDNRGGRLVVELDDRPRLEVEEDARGASGGRPPRQCEDDEGESSSRSGMTKPEGAAGPAVKARDWIEGKDSRSREANDARVTARHDRITQPFHRRRIRSIGSFTRLGESCRR
jgi:hypothetical protein